MNIKQLQYQQEIIRHLYFGGALACSELSDLTEKSLPLTSKILSELVELGIVVETGLANSTGGRRPQTYKLANTIMYVVTVAMDQFTTRIAIMDMGNNYMAPAEEVQLRLPGNPNALNELASLIERYILQSGIPQKKIVGIGIGMPGFVDVNKGINLSFLPAGEGESITSFLERCTGLPVFIDNDSSVIALAESRFGLAKSDRNVMVINVSWGIGLGLIVNKKLYRGDSGFAGEFSHIPLFSNNRMCSCGKIGCLETEASMLILIEKAIEAIEAGRSSAINFKTSNNAAEQAATIVKAALDGDQFAVELISDLGYNIGKGIAILIHILNPGKIVLSGRGAAAGNLWYAPVQQAINENCIPKISENTSVIVSNMGNRAELVGANCLVIENLEFLDFSTEYTSNVLLAEQANAISKRS